MDSVKLLQKLVSISSPSGQETEIQEWIKYYLEQQGLHPQYVEGNIVCHLPGADPSQALILNGHVDTVGAGDLSAWQFPALAGQIHNGKLYGLGAADMKAGIAVMLLLATQYSHSLPPVDLWFHFVVEEETTGRGTHDAMGWFAEHHLSDYRSAAGILLEPTSLQTIEIAHKGNIFLKLTAQGDSGHGSEPNKVEGHAAEIMVAAAEQVKSLVASWSQQYSDAMLGSPSIALTSITAGNADSPNKIPDSCTATFDLRTTPAVHDKALSLIKQVLAKNVQVAAVYDPLPAGYTAASEHIVQVAQKVTGLPLTTTPGSTDMLFFTELHIPAIILGPGEKSVEHKANEYVELATIEKTVTYITKIIEAL